MGKSMVKGNTFEKIGFDLISFPLAEYWLIGFHRSLSERDILHVPLELHGGTIKVGESVVCLYTEKSSAGFDSLYLVEPYGMRYEGIFRDLEGGDYALFLPEKDGKAIVLPPYGGYASFYYGYAYMRNEHSLLYTLSSGAGRVIEANEIFRSHEEIPERVKRRFPTSIGSHASAPEEE